MESIIPLNGRITIVDDSIDQALPLMRIFAKNNIPYVFYKGIDIDYLPEQPETDTRIMFLDLNLLGGRDNQPKEIVSSLYAAISHIISPFNFPYILVLWSRQEKEYKKLLEELFANSLKDRAPIAILEWIKSDYFENYSDEEVNKDQEYKIMNSLKEVISSHIAYSYLMQWENCIHASADETIQRIFHKKITMDNWAENANCILNMFAKSYLEQHYDDASNEDKAKASLLFLNDVYHDTLESKVISNAFSNADNLPERINEEVKKTIAASINNSLLFSKLHDSPRQPGCVLLIELTKENENYFHELFYNFFNKNGLPNNEVKSLKKEIYKSLMACEVVVTPACDYAQRKVKNDRVVQGVIINAEYKKYVNSQSDAFYVSPEFMCSGQRCIMILNFRYLITYNEQAERPNPCLRFRASILAEIQSKLSRHINRQGIMYL